MNVTITHKQVGLIACFFLLLQACSVKKFIPEEERLYTGAEIEIKADSTIKNQAQLKTE